MRGAPGQGYWARVWGDLRANRRASAGLGIVVVLAVIGLAADLIANDRPDPVIANHDLKRFERGVNIDERGAGPDPKLHG